MVKRTRKIDDKRVALKRAQGKTLTEIAKEEGVTAPAIFYALQRINPKLREVLELNDYDLKKAVGKMIEMTEAKETKFFAHEGIVVDHREVEDNSTRLAARREMLRVHGVGDTVNVEHSGTVLHVLTPAEKKEAAETIQRLVAYDSDAENPVEGEAE